MRSATGGPGSSFAWPAAVVPFHLQVRHADSVIAQSTVDRTLSPQVTTRSTTKKADGFVGTFAAPDSSARPAPAILVLGGSEGGNSGAPLARVFAAKDRWPHQALSYVGAGHYVGTLLPYGPTFDLTALLPADAAADTRARRAAWPALLDFITGNSR